MPDPPRVPRWFAERSTVVTVGTFDGVHRGHRELLLALCETAAARGRLAVVVTFEPHPLRVVRPETAPPLLTTRREKIELLAQYDVDRAVLLHFDAALAAFPPARFVEEILVHSLGLEHLVVGYDHGFGRDRSGNADTLRAIGRELGFGVDVVPPRLIDGEPVSSSRIRRALAAGDVEEAAACLGRPYDLRARVVRGDGRGRTLGFATANLDVGQAEKLLPAEGIYVVEAALPEGILPAVLHLGPRPTFPGARPTVELHVLDFDGSLYGQEVGVRFCSWLRGIVKFDGEAALIRAMAQDCDLARARYSAGSGACRLWEDPVS